LVASVWRFGPVAAATAGWFAEFLLVRLLVLFVQFFKLTDPLVLLAHPLSWLVTCFSTH